MNRAVIEIFTADDLMLPPYKYFWYEFEYLNRSEEKKQFYIIEMNAFPFYNLFIDNNSIC